MRCPYRFIHYLDRSGEVTQVASGYFSERSVAMFTRQKRKITSNEPCSGRLYLDVYVTYFKIIGIRWVCTCGHRVYGSHKNLPLRGFELNKFLNEHFRIDEIDESAAPINFWEHVKID